MIISFPHGDNPIIQLEICQRLQALGWEGTGTSIDTISKQLTTLKGQDGSLFDLFQTDRYKRPVFEIKNDMVFYGPHSFNLLQFRGIQQTLKLRHPIPFFGTKAGSLRRAVKRRLVDLHWPDDLHSEGTIEGDFETLFFTGRYEYHFIYGYLKHTLGQPFVTYGDTQILISDILEV